MKPRALSAQAKKKSKNKHKESKAIFWENYDTYKQNGQNYSSAVDDYE
jgi:hypothetical protein